MASQDIFAKSRQQGGITLAAHTRSVLDAVTVMFGQAGRPTRLAEAWLRFFGLPTEAFDAFLLNIWLASACHDLGKANDGFQAMVTARGSQIIRHEHLSALLLWEEPVHCWLSDRTDRGVDPDVVAASVATHHLKVSHEKLASSQSTSDRAAVQVYADAPDVAEVLTMAAEPLAVPPAELGGSAGRWRVDYELASRRRGFQGAMSRFGSALRRDRPRRQLLLAVRAAVIAADSAGSAMVRKRQDLEEWLRSAFHEVPLTPGDIDQGIIQPRIAELERLGRWNGLHDFQRAAAELGPRALLVSGCGSGKTLAAWKWVAAQLGRRPASRALFLYPTRATSTEGFRDYVSWAGPETAALLHGTAAYDLQGMFANSTDPRADDRYDVEDRLFALAYWPKRIFSATVDSFLAFIANRYAAQCLVPLLADSVVVIDEVHSFDDSMFMALDRFLAEFDVPVFCMTASLPNDRLTVLQNRRLDIFPRSSEQFDDLRRQSLAPRYRVRCIDPGGADRLALDAAKRPPFDGRPPRVLWVVNTVARCQAVARRLLDQLEGLGLDDDTVLCYHSRFRLRDRKKRHDAVIMRFRDDAGPLILVTTQVCEMSLDLDADILITEAAPVPSLIQRMGRCCRVQIPPPGQVGEVYVYMPEHHRPYTEEEIRQGEEFAQRLGAPDAVSQADLASELSALKVLDPFIDGRVVPYLDQPQYASSRDEQFRDDDDFAVDCILDSDITAYVAARRARDPGADAYVVPVPRWCAHPDERLGAFLRRAPANAYSHTFGFDQEVVKNARDD